MAHIARRYYALASWGRYAMARTSRVTGMAMAEVFDTRDGSTILYTRAFIARRICKSSIMPIDYDIL